MSVNNTNLQKLDGKLLLGPGGLVINGSQITSGNPEIVATVSGSVITLSAVGGTLNINGSASGSSLPSQGGNNGKVLGTNGTVASWVTVSGTGTVTSVGITPGTGLTVSGSPVTTAGNITVGLVNPTANMTITALTATTLTIPDNNEYQILDTSTNASNANVTVTLPAAPVNGQHCRIAVQSVAGTGTVPGSFLAAPNSGQILAGGTSFNASVSAGVNAYAKLAHFIYQTSNTTWYRVA